MTSPADVQSRVLHLLSKHMTTHVDSDGDIVVQSGSAVCFIRCASFGSRGITLAGLNVVVKIGAPILWDVARTPELYEWVATEGQAFVIGHVVCYRSQEAENTNLFLEYALFGDNLDEPEIVHAVGITLSMANGLDDQLQPRFGGRKSIE